MANFNFNKFIIGGRLTADPELRTTPSGISVTTFTVAVNRRFQKEGEEQKADFFNVTAWRQTAEFITKFFRKASSICVMGEVQTRSYTDEQGVKRLAWNVIADEAFFVDSKTEAPIMAQPMAQPMAQAASYIPEQYQQMGMPPAPKFESLSADDELPF